MIELLVLHIYTHRLDCRGIALKNLKYPYLSSYADHVQQILRRSRCVEYLQAVMEIRG